MEASFSVESRLHAETEYQRGVGQKRVDPSSVSAWIPAQFQRGNSHLVKKQSVRVSAWSRAQFQHGGKFQRGNAFSMLILSISVGTENTIVFS